MLSAQLETSLDSETKAEIKDEVESLKIENLQDWKMKRGIFNFFMHLQKVDVYLTTAHIFLNINHRNDLKCLRIYFIL